jgi:hypothetical protein
MIPIFTVDGRKNMDDEEQKSAAPEVESLTSATR